MSTNPASIKSSTIVWPQSRRESESLIVCRLTNDDQAETLKFLRERPLHTAVMRGLIYDHGIESALNRGRFYGCRSPNGQLRGVALIGHAIFVEAHSGNSLKRFARLAWDAPGAHMIMGEQGMVDVFWSFYAGGGCELRSSKRAVLLELREQPLPGPPMGDFRPARLDELPAIISVHAALAMEESGVNPLDKDPIGFAMRCRRRVEQGRVWVLLEGDDLIFKADIISDTPEVVYLEGIYVHPQKRGRGIGSRCLSELCGDLLQRTRSVSLLVNDQRSAARRFFDKLGFVPRADYDTIFLRDRH